MGILAPVTYDALGISPFDVDHWVDVAEQSGSEGRGGLHASSGQFDPDEIEARLQACAECPPPDVEGRRGWRVYSWGGDFEEHPGRRLHPPAFDHRGRGGRLAVSERLVMRALSTDDIRAMVDASAGEQSLADVEEFRLAAEALQRLEVWTAFITERTFVASGDQEIGGELLPRYRVLGHGSGHRDGRYVVSAVLVHETEEDAAESARLIADRVGPAQQAVDALAARQEREFSAWDDLLTDLQVQTDGRVTLVTLQFEEFDLQGGFILFLNALLSHE